MALTQLNNIGATQLMRGMSLRTHPDFGLANAQLSMTSCAEIITDKGTRVFPRSNLICNKTAAGLGGLDTGSLANSTWYAIYYAFKGAGATTEDNPQAPLSDGLFISKARSLIIDQQFVTTPNNWELLGNLAATQRLAQGIQFTNSGNLEAIDVRSFRTGTPSGQVWLQIEADSAGSPSGTALATSDKMNANGFPTSNADVKFIFRTPLAVVAATQYHIVFYRDYTNLSANYLNFNGVTLGGYANGVFKKFDGAAWAASGQQDVYFKTYMTQNASGPTLPSGYTEKCLIGYVYNASGNTFNRFVARNRRQMYIEEPLYQLFNIGGLSVPTLQDMSALLPYGDIGLIYAQEAASGTSSVAFHASGVPDGICATGQPGSCGEIRYDEQGAAVSPYLGPLWTAYQAAFVWNTAGTPNQYFQVYGFEW